MHIGQHYICQGGKITLTNESKSSDDCFPSCDSMIPQYLAHPEDWRPLNMIVDHCLSQVTNEACKLMFSMPIALTVIVMNAIKIGLILSMIFTTDTDQLLSIGDALQSFLKKPYVSKQKGRTATKFDSDCPPWPMELRCWTNERRKFNESPGKGRWTQTWFV